MTRKQWTIAVLIDDRMLKVTGDGTEAGTVFEGAESDIIRARAAIRHKVSVWLGAERRSLEAMAGYESPLALTAALFSVAGSYTILEQAPKKVMKALSDYDRLSKKDTFVFAIDEES